MRRRWQESAGMAPFAGTAARTLILAHLALSPLVFSRDTVEAFESPKSAGLMLTALALAALGAVAITGRTVVAAALAEPVALGVVLFCVSAAASTVTSMSLPTSLWGARDSDAGLVSVLAYAVLYFATRATFGSRAGARRLLYAPVFAAAVAALYAVVQVVHADPVRWGRAFVVGSYPRPFATMGHPNVLAAYLAMAFPLGAEAARAAGRAGRRWAAGTFAAVALISAAVVVVSESRGAWLALLVGLAVLACGWLGAGDSRGAKRLLVALPMAAGVVVLGLSAFGGAALVASVIERARHLTEATSRAEIWRVAWRIFLDHPVLGSGLDTFRLAFPPLRTVEYWLSTDWNATPTRAHDEVLQTLATQGLVGAIALSVLAVALLRSARVAWRRAPPEDRPRLAALLAGLAAFGAQGLFGFTTVATGTLFVALAALVSAAASAGDAPLVGDRSLSTGLAAAGLLHGALLARNVGERLGSDQGAVVWLLLAVAAPLAIVLAARSLEGALAGVAGGDVGEATPVRVPSGRALLSTAGGVCAALLGAGLVVGHVEADVACKRGLRLSASDPSAALEAHRAAVALEPGSAFYWSKLGIAAQAAAARAAGAAERQRCLTLARNAFEQAVHLVPADARYHLALGRVLADLAPAGLASPAEALARCDEALAMDPRNAYFYATAGNAALAVGDHATARRLAQRCVALYPRFATPHYQLGAVALREERHEEAARELKAAFYGEWHGEEDAGRLLSARLLAQALERLGRREEADGFARWTAAPGAGG